VSSPLTESLTGKTVGQYEIVAKIGGGGMGVVYKARDTRLGRFVALKFLPPQWSHDDALKQRFIREAQAASAADHQNICAIHNIETTADDQLYIVMAFCDGVTLKQRLQDGALPLDTAIDIAVQVSEGLARAHAQGVVHRDIKPSNLILTEDGIKILDFGLAKFADSLKLTTTGATLGTVAYMSPEQARGEEADARGDIWAVGVVLYQMLTGELPFKGGYPEAILYSVRNEDPAPPRTLKPGLPEAVERVVLRALEKNPANRYQTARDLARELRGLRGQPVPFDLGLEPVVRAARSPALKRAVTSAAIVLVAISIAGYKWLASPVPRIPVVVAPFGNETGARELDPYRLALTQTLIDELFDSRDIRVMSYERLLDIVRGFTQEPNDPASRDAVQTIMKQAAAEIVVVPTLMYENGAWRAKAEFRNAQTATTAGVVETAPIASAIGTGPALALTTSLANEIAGHFRAAGPGKPWVLETLRAITGRRTPPPAPHVGSLDAAATFERASSAYQAREFSTALKLFNDAAVQDARNPIPLAWASRAAHAMRQDEHATKLADRATALVTAQTSEMDALFIAAVASDARRDAQAAEAGYRELIARQADEPRWSGLLAAFLDAEDRDAQAIEAYHRVLALDGKAIAAHVRLCFIYSPARLNETARAKEEAMLAIAAYQATGNRAGEAHTLSCTANALYAGSGDEKKQAEASAQRAIEIFEALGYRDNTTLAQNYLALTNAVQGQLTKAVLLWERSLASATELGNLPLQALILTNLGAAHQNLGHRGEAIAYYQRSSKLFETLGDIRLAAHTETNAGGLLVQFGSDPERAARDLEHALQALRKIGDKPFEIAASQFLGELYHQSGRLVDAEREYNRAIAIAKEQNLGSRIGSLTLDLAFIRVSQGQYPQALELFKPLFDGTGRENASARINAARAWVRLGAFESARLALTEAAANVDKRGDMLLRPRLHLALGELSYEKSNFSDARKHFAAAASAWTDDLPDEDVVMATAYLGLIDGLAGRHEGAVAVQRVRQHAQASGRIQLETRCRIFLARLAVSQRQYHNATDLLADVRPDTPDRTIGPEIQAQVLYWRGRALDGRGDAVGAKAAIGQARDLLERLRSSLPPQDQKSFSSRSDVRWLNGA
jgi:tetratricopeptide (TPR) repeat protein